MCVKNFVNLKPAKSGFHQSGFHQRCIRDTILKFIINIFKIFIIVPADIYLLKISNRNTRARCEVCSKLTIKTPK